MAPHASAAAATDGQVVSSESEEIRRLHARHAQAERDELTTALGNGTVTFHEVARAWFGIHDCKLGNDEEYDRYRKLYRELLDAFAAKRGGIESDYFCEHISVAAALTDIEQAARSPFRVQSEAHASRWARLRRQVDSSASASAIHVEPLLGQPEDWESKRLISRCLDLHYRALEFLSPQHRKVCLRRLFAVITSLLGTLDSRAAQQRPNAPVRLRRDEVARLATEIDECEQYYQRHAERRAQLRYVLGMLGFGVPLVCAALVAAIAIPFLNVDVDDPGAVTVLAGAIGGVVSVLMRLTRGSLVLEREISTLAASLLGAVRPLIGAVFGVLVYVLIQGGLLPLTVDKADNELLTFAGLAFVAGFTERIVQAAAPDTLDVEPQDGRQDRKASTPAPTSGADPDWRLHVESRDGEHDVVVDAGQHRDGS